jgi:inner membrane protein
MASLGHVAIGLAAARWQLGRGAGGSAGPRRLALAMTLMAGLALLPDADVVAFRIGIPYGAPFGHRGASHALLAAPLLALLPALAMTRLLGASTGRALLLGTLVVATHGLLDTLTDGGLGVALLWPFSDERFFAPWRPIPVAPIGLRFLGRTGLRVALTELAMFLPLLLYALWPRRRAPTRRG